MKNLSKYLAMIVIGAVIGFSLAGCDTDTNGGGTGGTTSYTVSFDAGNGSGTPPADQTVNAGSNITLPGKGSMTAPAGQSFNGWRTGGQNYAAGDSYTVNGNVAFIAQWTTGGGATTPNAPTGVTATAQSSSSISVSWNAVSGATSYKVYYEIGSSTTKNLADTVTGTSYTHTGLQASTTYYYYITAVNSAGESGYSSSDSATTSSSGGGGGTTIEYRIDQALFGTNSKSGNNLVFNWTLKTSGKTPNGLYTYTSPSSIVVSVQQDGGYYDLQTLAGSARTYTLTNFAAWAENDRVYFRVKCVSTYNETISYVVYRPSVNTFTPSYP
ncbi:hypothetical protein FACS189450_13510 [Spirochaetia bacterium]|nr:hypothetical protein FACS189450_13510 [Spirochaetia bacterium]GHU92737.1 hypothetical protein FACS189479_02550 [Spirochaetia bacterium]